MSLPQCAVHNHHSDAEDVHMLWKQIRHSKEQQTFSASSSRAALSALTPAVWRYCSQAALRLRFICTVHMYTYTNTPTHIGLQQWWESINTWWHLAGMLPRKACYIQRVCLCAWVCEWVGECWVMLGQHLESRLNDSELVGTGLSPCHPLFWPRCYCVATPVCAPRWYVCVCVGSWRAHPPTPLLLAPEQPGKPSRLNHHWLRTTITMLNICRHKL